jgi:hypothetical protein
MVNAVLEAEALAKQDKGGVAKKNCRGSSAVRNAETCGRC